ncbi:hydrogenase 4 subunit F [Desulfovibrio sp. 86]|uniref:Hydrogenase 4, membrane subunit n=1 Tax=uncultured Desulfovibrio sp. TaxID=167968 RepID=A0A212L080_9BACT|nr:hydrogenase 4 subunit F [Desulfovibrio sp. 86]SCM70974.1 hydrogenase 4, membrane subunit [uncultured Desulfovibrio sp.]VZH32627.1 Hydrogenase-4 component F [Desulfovibrio sp. 86]
MNAMTNSSPMLFCLLLAAPLVTSLLCFACAFCGRGIRTVVNIINTAGCAALLATAFGLVSAVYEHGPLFAAGKWMYLDSLSAIFLAVLGVLGTITGLYSYGYMKQEVDHGEVSVATLCNYYGFFHMFIFTMVSVITTNNLILMWAGVEATTLASAFLVGIYGQNSSLEAAWKYIIICTVGVAFGLYGTVLVYSNASAAMSAQGLDPSDAIFWTEALRYAGGLDQTLMYLAFVFVLIGFGTKAGLFPMHAWLPDAHSEAPSPTSALLSAVLLKAAILVILRYYILISRSISSTVPQNMLLALGLLSILVAAFSMVSQNDIKRRYAYCSVENMGIIAVGLGFGGPLGIFAALFHVISHSLAKGLVFCVSGNVLLKYSSRDMTTVRGMLKIMPVSAVFLAAGTLALSGLPPFSVFLSEFMVVVSGISSGHMYLVAALAVLLMVALGALVHLVAVTLSGPPPESIAKGEQGCMTLIPAAALLGLLLVMGTCTPAPVVNMLNAATNIVLDKDTATAQVQPALREMVRTASQEAVATDAARQTSSRQEI